jgi:hypothetical protein
MVGCGFEYRSWNTCSDEAAAIQSTMLDSRERPKRYNSIFDNPVNVENCLLDFTAPRDWEFCDDKDIKELFDD